MQSTWAFLQGKKTYIVAAVAVAYAATQLWTGTIDGSQFIDAVLAAAGLAGLRHGISTS